MPPRKRQTRQVPRTAQDADAESSSAQRMPDDVLRLIFDEVASGEEQHRVRHPPRGFKGCASSSSSASEYTLLNCAHVCRAWRQAALPVLWRDFCLSSVAGVQCYDGLLAETPNAEKTYGHHVLNLRFTWDCNGQPPYTVETEEPMTVQAYMVQHDDHLAPTSTTLLQCAFAKRAKRKNLSEARVGVLLDGGNSWYPITDGPDGWGALSKLKEPSDLSDAMVRILKHLPNLNTLEWNGSVLPLSAAMAAAIEAKSGDTLHTVHLKDYTRPLHRDDYGDGRVPKHAPSVVPGLFLQLKHLRVDAYYGNATDVHDADEWLDTSDASAPFGITVRASSEPLDFDTPSMRWLVQQCWLGRQHALRKVTVCSGQALREQALWPLALALDVRFDEATYMLLHDIHEEDREDYADEVEEELYDCKFAQMFVKANAWIREAMLACTDRSKEDWLKPVLEALARDMDAKAVAANDGYGDDQPFIDMGTFEERQADDDGSQRRRLLGVILRRRRKWGALEDAHFKALVLLEDDDLRAKVARWAMA